MLEKGSTRKIWIICNDRGRAQCLLRFIWNQWFCTLESWHIPARSSVFHRRRQRRGCASSSRNLILLCGSFTVIPREPFTPSRIFGKKETGRNISWRNVFVFKQPDEIHDRVFGDAESRELFHLLSELSLSSNSSLLIFMRISGLDNSSFIRVSRDNRACVSLCKASFTKFASWLFPGGEEQYNKFYNN